MQTLIPFLLFYRKLVIPLLALALLVGFFVPGPGLFKFGAAGIVFIFFTPVFHFFIYEIRRPNEYYFYYNLGLSKIKLWISTCSTGLIIGLILNVI